MASGFQKNIQVGEEEEKGGKKSSMQRKALPSSYISIYTQALGIPIRIADSGISLGDIIIIILIICLYLSAVDAFP